MALIPLNADNALRTADTTRLTADMTHELLGLPQVSSSNEPGARWLQLLWLRTGIRRSHR